MTKKIFQADSRQGYSQCMRDADLWREVCLRWPRSWGRFFLCVQCGQSHTDLARSSHTAYERSCHRLRIRERNICKHYRIRHNKVNKDIHNPVSFHSLFNRTGQYVNRAWFRAATNDYFDNRLVGRLFFRLIRWNKIIFFYWQNTHYSTFFSMSFKLIECYENIVFNLLNHLS